jgi:hypothetical protein
MGVNTFPVATGGSAVTQKIAEFTSSGTFTAPSNCTTVEVFAVGGGGGGGSVIGYPSGSGVTGGGGGGGGVIRKIVPVTAGSSYTVTIGAGGTGGTCTGTTSVTPATNGGSTTFGSLVTAYGGTNGASLDAWNSGSPSFNTPTFGPGGGGSAQNNLGSNQEPGFVTGGGGGGANMIRLREMYAFSGGGSTTVPLSNSSTQVTNANSNTFANHKSLQGLPGKTGANNTTTGSISYLLGNSMGGYGIDGYGGGGGGGTICNTDAATLAVVGPFAALGSDGGGSGALILNTASNTSTAGSAATANTGGGGGGGATKSTDATIRTANGGAGAAGYVKVIYWS